MLGAQYVVVSARSHACRVVGPAVGGNVPETTRSEPGPSWGTQGPLLPTLVL